MNKLVIVLAFILAAGLAACGPRIYGYLDSDHPKSGEFLVENIELYYAHIGEAPKGAHIIDHLKQTGINMSCEKAAMVAIVQMQKKVRPAGGNALVNLKTVPEGQEPTSSDEGYWCVRSKSREKGADLTHKIWEITWEADIARVGSTPDDVTPPPSSTQDEEEEEDD
ncbi:MAG: hypothetical protein ABIJ56_06120 [Pseudomonadota bacterium]